MPRINTKALNNEGYYTTDQACDKLFIGRKKLNLLREQGIIKRVIKVHGGFCYAYEANEILAIQKRMKNNGGVLGQ